MTKTELRHIMRTYRSGLDSKTWSTISAEIQEKSLLFLHEIGPEVVHIYRSSPGHKEVDTSELYNRILDADIRLVVPKVTESTGGMTSVAVNYSTPYSQNRWGIYEPESDEQIDESDISLVFVPMLASDLRGNRLGFGKGYYDRFLVRTRAILAGLIPEDAILNRIPTENHDIPMDYLITECRIIRTSDFKA